MLMFLCMSDWAGHRLRCWRLGGRQRGSRRYATDLSQGCLQKWSGGHKLIFLPPPSPALFVSGDAPACCNRLDQKHGADVQTKCLDISDFCAAGGTIYRH